MLDTLNLILSIALFALLVLYFRLDKRTASNKKRMNVIKDRELDLRIITLESNLTAHSENIRNLAGEISKLQTEILKLATQNNNSSGDIERAYMTIDSIQEKIAELEVSTQNLSNKL